MPGMSRAQPSVTKAAAPWFVAMPSSRSPVTAVVRYPSVDASGRRPAVRIGSMAKTARLSAGPAWQVSATPQKSDCSGNAGLDAVAKRAPAAHRVDEEARLDAR